MKSIRVSPKAASASSATNDRAAASLSPEALALFAALPPLPPFTAGHDQTHTDPLLFAQEFDAPPVGSSAAAAAHPSLPHPAAAIAAAVAPLNPIGGYDLEFVQSPPDPDLVCVICSLVCRDAVETVRSGHGRSNNAHGDARVGDCTLALLSHSPVAIAARVAVPVSPLCP